QAAARCIADAGEQKAALALGAERKRHPRQIDQRHAFEIDARGAPGAQLGTRVERDAVGAQAPGLVARRTGREADALQADDTVRRQAHDVGGAARGALAQLELRGLEIRSLGCRIAAALPRDVHDGIAVVDAALGADGAVLRVVLDGIRADRAVALAHVDVALQAHIAVDSDAGLVAGDADFAALVRDCGRRRGARRRGRSWELRGTGWICGARRGHDATERQDGDPKWARTRHEGRHYNGARL